MAFLDIQDKEYAVNLNYIIEVNRENPNSWEVTFFHPTKELVYTFEGEDLQKLETWLEANKA